MTTSPLIIPVARFFDASGEPLASGYVETFAAGTNTPKATFTDFGGGTPNPTTLQLDSSGQVAMWLDGNYKINLFDSNMVQQANYPVDNVSSISSGGVSEYAVTTGSANAYILTPTPAIVSYTAGQAFTIKMNATNTGPTTINVSSLGTKPIVKLASTALAGGELITGTIYRIIYDGTNFQIVSSSIYGFQSTAIASATPDLSTVTGAYAHITGTTTITSFGTVPAGGIRILDFEGILTLTYNATSLILPTAANITTAAGDTAGFVSEGAGNWRCLYYNPASGLPLTTVSIAKGGTGVTTTAAVKAAFNLQPQLTAITASGTFTTSANVTSATKFKFTVTGGGGGGSGIAAGNIGAGGGSGGTAIYWTSGLAASTGYTVTIGAAGGGGSSGANNGTAGGDSSIVIGATTVTGGGGGAGITASTGGSGGTASSGTLNIVGAAGGGGAAINGSGTRGGNGMASYWGGGGAGGIQSNGGAGGAYGAGGGGGQNDGGSARAGGAGGTGVIIAEWSE